MYSGVARKICESLDASLPIMKRGYLHPHLRMTNGMNQVESQIKPAEVLEQTERVLASPLFRNSKRYPDLLRYVVGKTLRGETDAIKERTLGIEVFHRQPDYDTNADPVVRVAAGEVRKRLAQYYTEDRHKDELRIDLPSGSYLPIFRVPAVEPSTLVEPADKSGSKKKLFMGFAAGVVIFVIGIFWIQKVEFQQRHALQIFWAPMLHTPSSVLLCVGSAAAFSPTNANPSIAAHPLASDPITFSDAVTLTRIAGFLEAHRKSFQMQSAHETTFSDLQKTPSILISGFDNPWTIRLTNALRFHFVELGGEVSGIADAEHPQNQAWSVDFQTPYTQMTKDYGILARFHDPITDQQIVVAAGVGENGTVAASMLALNENYMAQMLREMHFNAARQNLEVVFSTEVIDGHPGPPHVLASTQW